MAVLGLLIFLYFTGPLKSVEGVVTRIFNPLFSKVFRASSVVLNKYREQTNKVDMNKKVTDLEDRVAKLTKENVELEKIKEENEVLRGYLDFLTTNKYDYVMSNVIARGDTNNVSGRTEFITIDKGSNNGLRAGLAVVSNDGVIVGKLAEVKNGTSQVILTNNENCKLAATIFNETKTGGIAEGEMGLTIKMGFIPQDQKIEPGNIVVSSGLEQFIPRGLIIGKVIEVDRGSNELWQGAVVEPMIDFEKLIVVSVLLPQSAQE